MSEDKKEDDGILSKFSKLLKVSTLRKKIKKKEKGEASIADKINFGGKRK